MTRSDVSLPIREAPPSDLETRLRAALQGEVRFDRLARAMYATDASIYEIVPLGVVYPKCVEDVVAVVRECQRDGTPIIARGAGTGLAGGAVGAGVQLDFSRHLTHIRNLDLAARTVEVEPGVVLDELNATLAPHGLHFAPDVATASRATIGGMIANNSCGAHSIVFGRTVDHVAELSVVLGDGEIATFRDDAEPPSPRGREIEKHLARIRDDHADEIARRFPKIMRSNGGYGLDRLGPPGSPARAVKVLCGSEGTLAFLVGAKLRLVPIPKRTSLVVLHFSKVHDALAATPAVLNHRPAAVELIDKLILDAGRANPALARRCDFLQGDPSALLVVEFFGETDREVADHAKRMALDPAVSAKTHAAVEVLDPARQADVWKIRTSGLGLLMSKPGDAQPYSFVEDSAVDPARLADYIARFVEIMDREGVHAGYYAHASVGCIHVKPVLNLKRGEDIEKMRRIAESAADLAVAFDGAVTGEHGDGIVRSCFLEKVYGPRIVAAFRQVKQLFDPHALLNPHKILDPWSMTANLRQGSDFSTKIVKTYLDFSEHGGMAGLAGMCTGVGQCRQKLVGVMCPSYMATGDETHTTRARANALRMALSNRGLIAGLDDPALDEVMDLCLGCKACKSECPTGVDMAKLKAEYLAHKHLRHGADPRSRFLADMPARLARAARFPRTFNFLTGTSLARAYAERRFGLDRRIAPPKLATRTFRQWFRRRTPTATPHPRGSVVYFVDTWTNYFTPQVGIAAVRVLEYLGYRVHCPHTMCCGRTAISQGLLAEAKQLADSNVRILGNLVPPDVAIVGTEPSCLLTLVDEYPQLVRTGGARRIAAQSMMIETFLARTLEATPDLIRRAPGVALRYHAHCHQKAIIGSTDAMTVLRRAFGDRATEIDSGCCGMAGAFGHEVEHHDVARAIGEHRLFPAVRARGEAQVAVSGFSCKTQIEHHTGAKARHWIEHLADGLSRDEAQL